MDKSVLMLLFLGCFPLVIFQAYAVKCRHCDNYFYGECIAEYTTCDTKPGEVCRHFRITDPHNISDVSAGYNDCSDHCYSLYRNYGNGAQLQFCCEDHDLCNEEPISDETLQKIISESSVS